jgi:2-polyprenyl-6-methoxyphenol hydroxylase-like FAD-dependent oxidoreductase
MKLMSKFCWGRLGATVMATAAPAQAHGWHRGGDGAGLAIGAGILGLAVGAALADRPHGYVVEERYAPPPPPPTYYYEGPAYYGGYYAPPSIRAATSIAKSTTAVAIIMAAAGAMATGATGTDAMPQSG